MPPRGAGGSGADRDAAARGVAGGGIVVRADWVFVARSLMKWCEEHGVDYVVGFAKDKRCGG